MPKTKKKGTGVITVPVGQVEFSQRKWFKPDEPGFLLTPEVITWINKSKLDKENEYELVVGTDSHRHNQVFRFVTVIALVKLGKGGMYYYALSYEPSAQFKGNNKGRMFHEVAVSVETAQAVLDATGLAPIIDIDASPSGAGQFTSPFSDQLAGYAVASGFEARKKPLSPISSCVADRHSK